MNVRGSLVPVVDGRRALGHAGNGQGSVVLLEVGERLVGFSVDEVLDLLSVSADALAGRVELPGIDPRLVEAVGRSEDRSFVLLDFDAVLGPIF